MELDSWEKDVHCWRLIDTFYEESLREQWRLLESLRKVPGDVDLTTAFFDLTNLANGFANQSAHMIGYLVREVLQDAESQGISPEITLDNLVASLEKQSYSMYRRILQECGCEACEAVIAFDDGQDNHDNVQEERPKHCGSVEPWAQVVRKCSRGLSVTSLRNCEYFFASTPKMSAPTLSMMTPTDVQSCTRRYMKRYVDQLPADHEDYPSGWLRKSAGKHVSSEAIEVSPDHVIMMDGDSGHLVVDDDTDELLRPHVTHRYPFHDTIRFRSRSNDAPELRTAFKLYGEIEGTNRRKLLRTVHSGVESMRCARKVIATASRVYFHSRCDPDGRPAPEKDKYGRVLVDIYVQMNDDDGHILLLAEVVASQGHTFPILEGGLEYDVFHAMRQAKTDKLGFFQLPPESRRFPFRPWDVRDDQVAASKEQPVNNDQLVKSFVMVESSLANEGLVYQAPSTIKNAGMGLFLRPRYTNLPAGSYLCKYSTTFTAKRPSAESGKCAAVLKSYTAITTIQDECI